MGVLKVRETAIVRATVQRDSSSMGLIRDARIQWALGISLLLVTFYLFVVHPFKGNLMDFRVYFEAGQRWSAHESIYRAPYRVLSRDDRWFELHYFYPPFLAWGMSLCSALPYFWSKLAWCVANYMALLGCSVLIASISARFAFAQWNLRERSLMSFFFLSCFYFFLRRSFFFWLSWFSFFLSFLSFS